MRKKLILAPLVLALTWPAAWAAPRASAVAATPTILELGAEPGKTGSSCALDHLKTAPAPQDKACSDIRCEWVNQCRVTAPGWTDTYHSKVCLTSCGYWYDTGQTCCWTTQPGSC
jgi:hypothetical protein